MDVRQLEFFVAVAEERNFTRAAERVFVTQSGLSSSIRALERELSVQLFDRGPQGAVLTRSGETFLPRARHMLEDARAAQRELLQLTNEVGEPVRVGSEQCVGDLVDLVDLMASFRGDDPHAELSFEQSGSDTLIERLGSGDLDIALIAQRPGGSAEPAARGITTTALRREPFVLLSLPGHRIAEADSVSWSDLEGERFVDFQPSWVVRQVIEEATAQRGMSRRSAVAVDDVHLLIDMVVHGFGIAAVPASIAAKPDAAALRRIPIRDADLSWEIHMATAPQAGSAARAFAAMFMPDEVIAASRPLSA